VEDDTLEGIRQLLQGFQQLSDAERVAMGKAGAAFFSTHYNSLETAAALQRIFAT
jgi:hypothetical protein